MKRILTILFLLQLVYSASNAQIKLIGNITTNGKASYPTHIDSLGKGGMMVMPTIGTRDSIPLLRRKKGMLVYVQSVDSLYKLNTNNTKKITDNSDWVTIGLSSSADVDKFLKYAKTSDSLYIIGNTLIGSTLKLNSSSTHNDSVQFEKNKYVDSADDVKLVIGGGLRVDSNVYVNKDLEVNGNLILNTGLNFNDSLVVSKGARIQQGLKLVGKLDLRDSLTVKGISILDDSLYVKGVSILSKIFKDSSAIRTKLRSDSTDITFKLRGDSTAITTKLRSDSTDITLKLRGDSTAITSKLRGDSTAITNKLRSDSTDITFKLRGDSTAITSKLRGDSTAITNKLRSDSTDITFKLRGDSTAITTKLRSDSTDIRAKISLDSNTITTKLRSDSTKINSSLVDSSNTLNARINTKVNTLNGVVQNTLTVNGKATITDSLSVRGNTLIDNNLTVSKDLFVGGKLTVGSGLEFKDSLVVTRGARIDSSLLVKGKVIVNDSLVVNSDASISGNLYTKGITTIDSTFNVKGITSLKDSLNVKGRVQLDSTLSVKGITNLSDSLFVKGVSVLGKIKYDSTVINRSLVDSSNELNGRINLKLNVADTINMMSNSLRISDSADMLSNRLRITDTAYMMSNSLRISDSARMLSNRLKISDTLTMLSNRLRITDTAYMLSNRLRISDSARMLSNRLKISDTLTMLSNRLRITDTAYMMSNSLRISDSAEMLSNRLKITDTSTMLSSRIARDTVSLSKRIDVLANSTSSDKIKFTKDFQVRIAAGKTFGKYANNSTIPATGKTLDELLTDITTEVVHPTYRSPSVSISATPAAGIVEIGSTFAVALASTYTRNDGGASTATTYKNGSGSNLGGNTANITTINSATTFSVVIDYDTGVVKNNNLGLSDSSGIVVAGSVSTSLTYTPKYKKYWGASTSAAPTDSEILASVAGSSSWYDTKAASFTISISDLSTIIPRFVYYAYPASIFGGTTDTELPSQIKVGGFTSTSTFTKIKRTIVNAQGYSAEYYIYVSNNDFLTNTPTIEIVQ